MTIKDTNFAVTSGLRGDSSTSANDRRTWRDLVLRGGRVSKYKGIAGGIAPHSGVVSAVLGAAAISTFALGGIVLTTPAALAGSCSNLAISTCSGAAGAPGTDAPVVINQPGTVTVTTDPGFGIDAAGNAITILGSGVGDVTFTDNNQSQITGSNFGIHVAGNNAGAVSITTTGTVTSGSTGILAPMGGGSTGLTIDVNDVNAGGHAIDIRGNSGTGDVSVTANNLDAFNIGIIVDNGPSTSNFTVDVNKISSGSDGIYGFASGDGDVNITVHDSIVSGGNGMQLDVDASPGAGLVNINIGNIEAGGEGVNLDTNANTTDLTIDVNDVNSVASGIHFVHRGSGGTTVIANDITSTAGHGIWFESFGSVADVDDDVSVTANDIDVAGIGVWLDTYWDTNDFALNVNNITSGDDGINAIHSGDGTVDLTVGGSIVSASGDAIVLNADGNQVKDVTVNVNSAAGAGHAIWVANNAIDPTTSTLNVTTTGHIEAGSGWGIWTQTNTDVVTNITVKNGSVVEAASGLAIGNNHGDSHVVIENASEGIVDDPNTIGIEGPAVTGRVLLGLGGDRLDLHGGFSGITEVNGGFGGTATDDVLNLSQANSTFNAGQIVGWDVFNIDGSYLTTDGPLGGNLVVGTAHVAGTGIFLTNGSTLESNQPGMNIYGNLTLAAGTTYLSDVNDDAGNPGVGDTFITGFLANNGTVSIADEAADDNVRVDGLYSGDGGTVVLDTVLGDDSSATDRMNLLGGTAVGTTNLVVNNVGGAGAATSEGIKVIDVSGDSLGTFSLVGDYEIAGQQAVIAGAYGYTLWKNGVSNPTDGDWYLRSQLADGGKIYAPGVPIYEAYGQVLLGLNGLPTLQQRVGNRYWKDAVASAQDAAAAAPDVVTAAADVVGTATPSIDQSGVWGVIEGSYAEYDPDTSTSGAEYDLSIWKMRAGIDGLVSESERGKIIVGLNGFYGQGSSDISSLFGSGDISTDAYGIGATATWYDNNGFYLDGQGQLSWFDSDLKSDVVGELASGNNGFGYALSLEAGQRIDMHNNWTVIPQAQLVYSNVKFDSFDDQFGAEVKTDTADSLRGRLGLAMEHQNSWTDDQGQVERATFYGMTNLHYEFLDGVSVDVADTEIVSENDALWGEVGLGGSYNWNDDGYSIYGEVSANSSLENLGDSYVLNGRGGLRINW